MTLRRSWAIAACLVAAAGVASCHAFSSESSSPGPTPAVDAGPQPVAPDAASPEQDGAIAPTTDAAVPTGQNSRSGCSATCDGSHEYFVCDPDHPCPEGTACNQVSVPVGVAEAPIALCLGPND